MRKRLVTIILAISLAGCAGLTGLSANAELFTACFTYDRTLSVVNTLKPKMTPAQVNTMKKAVSVISPICKKGVSLDTSLSSVQAVRDGLRQIIEIEQEVAK